MLIFYQLVDEQADVRQAAGKTDIDEALMARIAQGDREALSTLYYQTQRPVFAFALSILRNRQNAEDVLHDTYIKVWDHAAAYRAQGKPMAWLLTITRNLCLMKLREHRNRDVPLDEQFYVHTADSPVASQLDRIVLEHAMASLPEADRQIVTLHALSGLKHREIAQLLQLPISTVLSKYRRALKKLEALLKEENPHGKGH